MAEYIYIYIYIGRSLEDLEYANDLARLSHSFGHIQEKTPRCLE